MIALPRTIRVWAYGRPTDLRKGYNGLVGLVKQQLRLDPLGGDLFLFVSRRRTGCKVLMWELTVEMLHGLQAVRERRPSPWRFTRFGIGRYR